MLPARVAMPAPPHVGADDGPGAASERGRVVGAGHTPLHSFGFHIGSEGGARSVVAMSVVEVVDDLLKLEDLARQDADPARRRSLEDVRDHVARRDRGAKVSEAAEVLAISQPSVRAWLDAGILVAVADTKPVRIEVRSLAGIKRALDLIRQHSDDRQLRVHVMRVLRDREALAGSDEGFADLRAGRVVPLAHDLRDEIDELRRRDKPRSKSN